MKNQIVIVKNNVIGSVAGAATGYFGAGKFGLNKMWQKILLAAVGALAGANIESMIKAKKGAAKSASVVKK